MPLHFSESCHLWLGLPHCPFLYISPQKSCMHIFPICPAHLTLLLDFIAPIIFVEEQKITRHIIKQFSLISSFIFSPFCPNIFLNTLRLCSLNMTDQVSQLYSAGKNTAVKQSVHETHVQRIINSNTKLQWTSKTRHLYQQTLITVN